MKINNNKYNNNKKINKMKLMKMIIKKVFNLIQNNCMKLNQPKYYLWPVTVL